MSGSPTAFSATMVCSPEVRRIFGAFAFLIAVPTAFAGFLIKATLHAEWLAAPAQNGLNARGPGWISLSVIGQIFARTIILLPFTFTRYLARRPRPSGRAQYPPSGIHDRRVEEAHLLGQALRY